MFYVYVLKSLKNGHFYIGQTQNVQERLERHNSGRSKATKHQGPYELIHVENYSTRSNAVKRESYFKSGNGYERLKNLGL